MKHPGLNPMADLKVEVIGNTDTASLYADKGGFFADTRRIHPDAFLLLQMRQHGTGPTVEQRDIGQTVDKRAKPDRSDRLRYRLKPAKRFCCRGCIRRFPTNRQTHGSIHRSYGSVSWSCVCTGRKSNGLWCAGMVALVVRITETQRTQIDTAVIVHQSQHGHHIGIASVERSKHQPFVEDEKSTANRS